MTEALDSQALAELKELADKATPGPWFREYGDVVTTTPDPRDVADMCDEPRPERVVRRAAHRDLRNDQAIADAKFIVAAREWVPSLISEVERLTAERDQARDIATALEQQNAEALRVALLPLDGYDLRENFDQMPWAMRALRKIALLLGDDETETKQ